MLYKVLNIMDYPSKTEYFKKKVNIHYSGLVYPSDFSVYGGQSFVERVCTDIKFDRQCQLDEMKTIRRMKNA